MLARCFGGEVLLTDCSGSFEAEVEVYWKWSVRKM